MLKDFKELNIYGDGRPYRTSFLGCLPHQRKKIREQIKEKYNWNSIAEQTIEVYQKALLLLK